MKNLLLGIFVATGFLAKSSWSVSSAPTSPSSVEAYLASNLENIEKTGAKYLKGTVKLNAKTIDCLSRTTTNNNAVGACLVEGTLEKAPALFGIAIFEKKSDELSFTIGALSRNP